MTKLNIKYYVTKENLHSLLNGDCGVQLWNTPVKMYPTGVRYTYEGAPWGYPEYCVVVFGYAYLGGAITEVFGRVDRLKDSGELVMNNVCRGDVLDTLPTYEESKYGGWLCIDTPDYLDDKAGSLVKAFPKAIACLERDMKSKSSYTQAVERQFEYKYDGYGSPYHEKEIAPAFLKNEMLTQFLRQRGEL